MNEEERDITYYLEEKEYRGMGEINVDEIDPYKWVEFENQNAIDRDNFIDNEHYL